MADLPHARRPCTECPWRLDQPTGRFPAARYEQLRATSGGPGREVSLGGPIFACHKTVEGRDLACAGWLAVCGAQHLGIRWAVATGRLPAGALEPGDRWPPLYPDYEAFSVANGAVPDA